MTRLRRLALGVGLFLFLFLFVFGVVGYMLIEGWPSLDALSMTAITVTTVG